MDADGHTEAARRDGHAASTAHDGGSKAGNRPAHLGGFVMAAVLAPAMALVISMVGPAIGAMATTGVGDVGGLIGGFLFLLVMVTLWGVIPSLVFGALVLAAIQSLSWRTPPRWPIFVAGGTIAALLYVAVGLGVHQISPGLAMLFAPWASMTTAPSADNWWIWTGLVLSGLAAGSIYARFAERG